jgi:hypothetical protein
MDFIHRPKSKILNIKIEIHNVSEAGSASVLRCEEGEKRGTYSVGSFRQS